MIKIPMPRTHLLSIFRHMVRETDRKGSRNSVHSKTNITNTRMSITMTNIILSRIHTALRQMVRDRTHSISKGSTHRDISRDSLIIMATDITVLRIPTEADRAETAADRTLMGICQADRITDSHKEETTVSRQADRILSRDIRSRDVRAHHKTLSKDKMETVLSRITREDLSRDTLFRKAT